MKITVTFRWPKRNYSGALTDYFAAKEFVLSTGLFNFQNVGGYIKAPRHPKVPEGTKGIPAALIDDANWHTSVVAHTDDEHDLHRIESLPLPVGCTRTVTDAK